MGPWVPTTATDVIGGKVFDNNGHRAGVTGRSIALRWADPREDASVLTQDLVERLKARLGNDSSNLAPPATSEAVQQAEDLLGWRLPADVVEYFTRVGSGARFYPGLPGGGTDDLGNDAVQLALDARLPDPDEAESQSGYVPRDDVLAVAYWGCSVYSWVCRDGTMIGSDGWDWIPDGRPFREWLEALAAGTLEQPRVERHAG